MIGFGLSPGATASGAAATLRAFPSEIPNLVAVYDPSDLSSLFQDTAGTVPAGVGDPVRLMQDKSGNARHMRAGSDAARPVLQSSGGLYWLEGDGVDDLMVADDGVMFSTTVYTALACRLLSFSTSFPGILRHAAGTGGSTAGRQPLVYFDSTLPLRCFTQYGTSNMFVSLGSSVVGTDLVIDSYVEPSGAYLNSNGVSTTGAGVTLTNTAPEAMRIFGTSIANARFYGALLTHTIPTVAKQAQIRQWLAAKSGGIA